MKHWLYLVGLLVTSLCIWFFAQRVAEHWHALRQMSLEPTMLIWLLGALLMYLATFASTSASWNIALRACGQKLRLRDCLRINLVSQFAKFIPGNVGQHIGRVVMATRLGASGKAVAASVLLDMLLLSFVAVALSLLNFETALILGERSAGKISLRWLGIGALAVVFTITVGCMVLHRFLPELKNKLLATAPQFRRDTDSGLLRFAAGGATYHAISFVLGAAGITSIIAGLSGTHGMNFTNVVGAYALAWFAGFILPGAPAGIGVRELVMVLALGPAIGEQTATATTALFRVVTTLGDGIAFALGLMMPRPAPAGISTEE